jgi:type VI secretion system secreted protein VgrG
VIPIASADYLAGSSTVVLHPAERLDVHNVYRLVVDGTTSAGLTDTAGRLLDGQGTGRPGSDFATLITRRTLIKTLPPQAVDALAASGRLSVGPLSALGRRGSRP